MFAVGDMHASMGDGEICGTGVEIAGEVTVRFDLLKGKQGTWPISETNAGWITHGTATEYPDAMREACREAAGLLVAEWGMSMEDAFMLLSVRADVGVAQACKPSPFATIARVVMPKLDAIPGPFRTSARGQPPLEPPFAGLWLPPAITLAAASFESFAAVLGVGTNTFDQRREGGLSCPSRT